MDDDRDTPFAIVAWDSPIPILKQMLKCGADIDSTDYRGNTQLMKRAVRNDAQTVHWLLQNGASVNLQDRRGDTALSLALGVGSVESAQALINCDADLTKLDRYGHTILHNACSHKNNSALVRYLVNEGISIDAVDYRGATALHQAARENFSEAVSVLLATDAEIDKADNEGCTPLMVAVFERALDAMELLIANHADIDKPNNKGNTPLMKAVMMRSTDAMNALLGAGANVNAQNHLGLTALHFAAQGGNVATVSELLKSGAIRATRSQMMISVTDDGFWYLDSDFHVLLVDEQTIIKHSDHVDPYSQRTKRDMGVHFFSRQRLQNLESWEVQRFLRASGEFQECRIWEAGFTALDIADIRKDTDCSSLLETVPGMSRSEYSTTESADMWPTCSVSRTWKPFWKKCVGGNIRMNCRRKTKSNTHITSPPPLLIPTSSNDVRAIPLQKRT